MARTDTLGNFLTDVADAIRAKGGTSAAITASDFDTAIANLPSGGGGIEKGDVTYFDYDGTIVAAYTAAEFANLTAHPTAPEISGLTFEEWNWSLSDAQTYVSKYGKINIGATRYTSDGKDRIYIKVPRNNYRVSITLESYGSVDTETIDWGDGSTAEALGTVSNNLSSNVHTYTTAGDYCITIYNPNHSFYLYSGIAVSSTIDKGGAILTEPYTSGSAGLTWSANEIIEKIELGNGANLADGTYIFAGAVNLKKFAYPKSFSYAFNKKGNFYRCYSLEYVTIPGTLNTIAERCFQYAGIKHISFNSSVRYLSDYCINNCPFLEEIYLPENYHASYSNLGSQCCSYNPIMKEAILGIIHKNGSTSTALQYNNSLEKVTLSKLTNITQLGSTFSGSSALRELVVPSTVSTVGTAFNFCYSLEKIDFSNHASVPTLSNTSTFTTCHAGFKIIVPDSLYSTWTAANNWSNSAIVDHIVKASEA